MYRMRDMKRLKAPHVFESVYTLCVSSMVFLCGRESPTQSHIVFSDFGVEAFSGRKYKDHILSALNTHVYVILEYVFLSTIRV